MAMRMPMDLVLVRHGQSEGNVAKRLLEKGRPEEVPLELLSRPGSAFRLTDRGIAQASVVGEWLRREFLPNRANGPIFDLHQCSELVRTLETAAYLNLPAAQWHRETRLQERDWGKLEMYRAWESEVHAASVKNMALDPFNIPPTGGESMRQLLERLYLALVDLDIRHRNGRGLRVIWVVHGEVMIGTRMLLEGLTPPEYKAMLNSEHPHDHMHNGQVLHYTRRDPSGNGNISDHLDWVRSVLPEDLEKSSNEWRRITRRTYTADELLADVARTPRIVSG